jgi:hypothetical protein
MLEFSNRCPPTNRRGWRDPEKGEIRSKSGDKVEPAASLPSVATDFESSTELRHTGFADRTKAFRFVHFFVHRRDFLSVFGNA